MKNKRRLVCIAPVQAVVGKLSKSAYKYSKLRYGEEPSAVGFTNKWSPANRYRIVTKTTDKKSASQIAIRDKFGAVCALVRDELREPTKLAQAQFRFKNQTAYATIRGMVFKEQWDAYQA